MVVSYLSPERAREKNLTSLRAPGLKFGFTGQKLAITFGPLTSNTVLVGYRVNGQDWQLTNITTNATHLLVSPESPAINISWPINPSTFELRVTNWAYGVQISAVHLSKGEHLIETPNFSRTIEFIGDSLSSGYTATLEGLSSFAYGMGAGLGNTEYSITAYPGICLFDKRCWDNTRGMFHQWYYTSDTSPRAAQIWGDEPELWDFSKQDEADLVVINLGTNDGNEVNNVTSAEYVAQYTLMIEGIHAVWPNAQIILMVSLILWLSITVTDRNSLYGKASLPTGILTRNLKDSPLKYTTSIDISIPKNTYLTPSCTTHKPTLLIRLIDPLLHSYHTSTPRV